MPTRKRSRSTARKPATPAKRTATKGALTPFVTRTDASDAQRVVDAIDAIDASGQLSPAHAARLQTARVMLEGVLAELTQEG